MDESWRLVPEGPREPRLNQHAWEIHQTYGKTMENMGIICVWRFLWEGVQHAMFADSWRVPLSMSLSLVVVDSMGMILKSTR